MPGSERSPRRSAQQSAQAAAQRLDAVRGASRTGWLPLGAEDVEPRDRAGRRARSTPGVTDSWRARLVDRLPLPLRTARWSVPLTVLIAVLALTGVAGVVVAVRTASAAPGVPVPARPAAAASTPGPTVAGGAPEVVGSTAGSTGAAPEAASTLGRPQAGDPGAAGAPEVVVHVVGQVVAPGLVRLPAGARVDDALTAAGGPSADADLTAVNLARPVVDGEQVVVPRPGEQPLAAPGGVAASAGAPGGAPAGAPAAGDGGAGGGAPVQLNTATLAQLDGLPGIGPVLAQRILDWRAENGRFTAVDELGEVSGIGERLLERLRPLVTV